MKALLALDGTPAAVHAADYLLQVVQQGDRVVLYHAVKGERDTEDSFTRDIAQKCQELVGESNVFLVTEFSKNVVQGILGCAKRENADVIVLGSHEKGVIKRAFTGSTSSEIMHLAHRPVLVVHHPPQEGRNRYLLCYDGTDAAKAALDFLSNFTRQGDSVSLFCAFIPPPVTIAAGNVAMRNPTYYGDLREMTERATHLVREAKLRIQAHAPHLGEGSVDMHVMAAEDPEREAVRYADEKGYKTLVCGSHGHGAVHRMLLGSFSDDLIHEAHKHAVLVVPAQHEHPMPMEARVH